MLAAGSADESPRPVDAGVKVYVSQDTLKATIYLEPPRYGGAELKPTAVDAALRASHVTYGLDLGLIEHLKQNPVYSQEMVIAQGTAPVDGTDGSISCLFRTEIVPSPKLRSDGTVDYRDLGLVENVRAGQTLCEIVLPTRGSEGCGVTGRKISQAVGLAVPSPVGRNTRLSEDGTRLTALVNGHVTFDNGRVNVSDTFIVRENVDNSTGNIRCFGNVQVLGNVLEGFHVEAEGNIEVFGAVEGGSLNAGGSIKASGGVVGMGQSVIECRESLTATFLENATVTAGGSIQVGTVMHCMLKCGRSLELVGNRAKIIGGRCIVSNDIRATSIGSPANLPTELILGVDPAVVTRRAALVSEVTELKSQLSKLEQVISLLSQYEAAGRLTDDKKGMLESSKLSLNVTRTRLTIKQKEIELITEKLENTGGGKVICRGTLYQGVRLTIGTVRRDFDETVEGSVFTCEEGRIVSRAAV